MNPLIKPDCPASSWLDLFSFFFLSLSLLFLLFLVDGVYTDRYREEKRKTHRIDSIYPTLTSFFN